MKDFRLKFKDESGDKIGEEEDKGEEEEDSDDEDETF